MVRSVAKKVAWVGRTASMVFGLALVLALVVGMASTAFGASGGKFILGSLNNTATAITKLTGTVGGGPALQVSNPSTATGSTALDLQVATGKAPLTVNSTGQVPKLNSDMVDGKDSSEFYAAGSTVTDSEKLGGKAPAEFAAAYKRTVVVSPVGTDTENGTALLDALSGITDASASKPYLLHIEPATYDLGNGSLSMKPYVDIEGSGELHTVITSGADCSNGRVVGANDAELRFLTVRNTGTSCGTAIYNSSTSPRLTHVTAESAGGGANAGVFNNEGAHPTMTSVTATASGGTENYGVYNFDSSATMTDVTVTASGGNISFGVINDGGSSATISQSKLSGSDRALFQASTGTAKVALTQLEGPVSRVENGTLQCFNNFDQNLAAVTCP